MGLVIGSIVPSYLDQNEADRAAFIATKISYFDSENQEKDLLALRFSNIVANLLINL